MRLKIRLPGEAKVVTVDSKPDTELILGDLLAALDVGVEAVKAGYPPKSINVDDLSQNLTKLGIQNGDQIIVTPTGSSGGGLVEGKAEPSVAPSKKVPENAVKCGDGFLILRVMEDDNSCMFRAFGYTLLSNSDIMFELRNIVASTIEENGIDYNDAILGKPRSKYIEWILKETSWGGAIELDILSKHFGITIKSLDVSSGRVDDFNPGQDSFVILVYSGIHYDAVAYTVDGVGTGDRDQTVFKNDEFGSQALESLSVLAANLKKAHYYTDTAQFQIICRTCKQKLIGEKGAAKHAEQTGHTDFGEV